MALSLSFREKAMTKRVPFPHKRQGDENEDKEWCALYFLLLPFLARGKSFHLPSPFSSSPASDEEESPPILPFLFPLLFFRESEGAGLKYTRRRFFPPLRPQNKFNRLLSFPPL